MIKKEKKICIFGTGGFARETLCNIIDIFRNDISKIEDIVFFMVDDNYFTINEVMGIKVIPSSKFIPDNYDVIVAVGDPIQRKKIVDSLPPETTYATLIHPNAIVSKWVEIGEGSIITAGVVLTCNIKIGKHAHLNLTSTVGHDSVIGDYFTASPSVNISGNCIIGDNVFIGTNACIKDSIEICNNTTIGMGTVVINNITEKGVYIGNPAKKLIKK